MNTQFKMKLNLMKSMKLTFLMGVTLISASVHANEGKVVDLGEMSVQGELRRPAITWIDSQKSVRELMPSIWKSEYESFELQLLEPTLKKPAPPASLLKSSPDLKPHTRKGPEGKVDNENVSH